MVLLKGNKSNFSAFDMANFHIFVIIDILN